MPSRVGRGNGIHASVLIVCCCPQLGKCGAAHGAQARAIEQEKRSSGRCAMTPCLNVVMECPVISNDPLPETKRQLGRTMPGDGLGGG
eukprot:scaffold8307_cov119-Isochrysis_galbana.AAC.5